MSKISIAICSRSQLLQSHKAFLSASHVRAARKNICIHNFTAQVFVSLFVTIVKCITAQACLFVFKCITAHSAQAWQILETNSFNNGVCLKISRCSNILYSGSNLVKLFWCSNILVFKFSGVENLQVFKYSF